MKMALYFENPGWQLILTPETKDEISILKLLENSKLMTTYWGEFYKTQGGFYMRSTDKESLMLILERDKEKK